MPGAAKSAAQLAAKAQLRECPAWLSLFPPTKPSLAQHNPSRSCAPQYAASQAYYTDWGVPKGVGRGFGKADLV